MCFQQRYAKNILPIDPVKKHYLTHSVVLKKIVWCSHNLCQQKYNDYSSAVSC